MKTILNSFTKTQTDSISKDISQNSDPNNIISTITLKKGRKAINIYISENYEEEKKNNPTFKSLQIFALLNEKWKKLPDEVKEKYRNKSKEEKQKYEEEINFVRQYFFDDLQNYLSIGYRYYLSFILKEGFENNIDLKELKIKAIEIWEKMPKEEKKKWIKKSKKENWNNWWLIGNNPINIHSFPIFCQKKIEESKIKNKKIDFSICAQLWKKISKNEKKKYDEYAEEINSERKKIRELLEIINGIQPKKPAGAYKIFLSEKAKDGIFKNENVLIKGRKMWNELSKEEKDEYIMKAKKLKLCYIYKKLLYVKHIKKKFPTKPKSAYNLFISSIKGMKPEKNENFFSMCKKLWDNINENDKQKFTDLAEEEMRKYIKKLEKFDNKVFNLPNKPLNSFQFYVMDNYPNFNEQDNNINNMDIFKKICNEWNNLTELQKDDYDKKAFCDKKRFLKENQEFNKYGYYIKKKKIKEDI